MLYVTGVESTLISLRVLLLLNLALFRFWFYCGVFVGSLQTEKGSALHEAALFGKTDVVLKLLREGQTLHLVNMLMRHNTFLPAE